MSSLSYHHVTLMQGICHELLTMLQEDGACMLSDQEGEPVELNLTHDIIVKVLRL